MPGKPDLLNPAEWMTVQEVADIVRRSHSCVQQWCRTGKLENVKLPGGGFLIPRAAVTRMLAGPS